MHDDDYDEIFDYDDDGELDAFEENEMMLFTYGDGSMHEPDGMAPSPDEDDEDDDGFDMYGNPTVYDEYGDPIDSDDIDTYDTLYNEFGEEVVLVDGEEVVFVGDDDDEFIDDGENEDVENEEDEDEDEGKDEDEDKDEEDDEDEEIIYEDEILYDELGNPLDPDEIYDGDTVYNCEGDELFVFGKYYKKRDPETEDSAQDEEEKPVVSVDELREQLAAAQRELQETEELIASLELERSELVDPKANEGGI